MGRRELEITDIDEIVKILDKAKFLHLGLVDEDMPYIAAMNYGFTIDGDKLTLYLHSAVKAYKIDVIKRNPMCCFELECDVEPFDGEMPCKNGMMYSSVKGRGCVEIIEDDYEKISAMKIFMKTQRGEEHEFTSKLLSAVTMMRIDVSEYRAKRRPHPLERQG